MILKKNRRKKIKEFGSIKELRKQINEKKEGRRKCKRFGKSL